MSQTIKMLDGKEAIKKFNWLKENGYILLEAIVGSQSYGTALPTSDFDKKFIYIEPLENVLDGTLVEQLNVNKDYVGYELSRFLELCKTQNPNIQELLWSPEYCIEYSHPLFEALIKARREDFISNKVYFSYGQYAQDQISKARGLNKKIVNPYPKERLTPLDFCYVPYKQGTRKVTEWLEENDIKQEWCGLTNLEHMKNNYHVFVDWEVVEQFQKDTRKDIVKITRLANLFTYWALRFFKKKPKNYFQLWKTYKTENYCFRKERYKSIAIAKGYKGILQKENSNEVSLSSIKKGIEPDMIMQFNVEGYQHYCKQYAEYWKWVENRNEERYQINQLNGCDYDSKNLMHCIRLLETAIDIFKTGEIKVFRDNFMELQNIRHGKLTYDEIINLSSERIITLKDLFEKNKLLPEEISNEFINSLLLNFRKQFYAV